MKQSFSEKSSTTEYVSSGSTNAGSQREFSNLTSTNDYLSTEILSNATPKTSIQKNPSTTFSGENVAKNFIETDLFSEDPTNNSRKTTKPLIQENSDVNENFSTSIDPTGEATTNLPENEIKARSDLYETFSTSIDSTSEAPTNLPEKEIHVNSYGASTEKSNDEVYSAIQFLTTSATMFSHHDNSKNYVFLLSCIVVLGVIIAVVAIGIVFELRRKN